MRLPHGAQYILSNGVHRLRLRVQTRAGRVVCQREVAFRVNHVGQLAEVTSRSFNDASKTKRIWADLVDS